VFDVRSPRKLIDLIFVSLEVLSSDFLHCICLKCMMRPVNRYDYKFVAYQYSILQEFAIKNVVMVIIHSERFSLGTVNQLHGRCICPSKVLRRITFVTDELDIPWDSSISSVFSRADSTLSIVCAFLNLPSTAVMVQSRSRPPTRRALRLIGLGDSDRSRVIRTKRYIESLKNSEKITTNLKKI